MCIIRTSRTIFTRLSQFVTALLLAACAGIDDGDPSALLQNANWYTDRVTGGEFELAVFAPRIAVDTDELHVYLGGDGRAFLRRDRVSADPTGRQHLTLQLAMAAPSPSLFLGRPCYYGGATEAPCHPRLWTRDRYGAEVVDSIVEGVEAIAADYPRARLTLVGYSGGGVLALLAARRLQAVDTVITIAAPLDTDRWTELHGYTPLAPEGNPSLLQGWPERLNQRHLTGEVDDNVPPGLAVSFMEQTGLQEPMVIVRTYPGFDHRCCWLRDWPDIIRAISANTSP